jgi:hypothetical protein
VKDLRTFAGREMLTSKWFLLALVAACSGCGKPPAKGAASAGAGALGTSEPPRVVTASPQAASELELPNDLTARRAGGRARGTLCVAPRRLVHPSGSAHRLHADDAIPLERVRLLGSRRQRRKCELRRRGRLEWQSAGPPPATHEVDIVGRDYAFTAPRELPAGRTTFRFTNKGKVIHELDVALLKDGTTARAVMSALSARTPLKPLGDVRKHTHDEAKSPIASRCSSICTS